MEDEAVTTEFKVYISRLPTSWTAGLIVEHFSTLGFGAVAGAEIFTTRKKKARVGRGEGNVCYAFKNDGKCERGANCPFSHGSEGGGGDAAEESLGSGVVYFHTEMGVALALAQRSLYVSHRTIRISAFESVDDGRDVTACYAWAKGQCTHGDECKFSHAGPGACMAVGKPYAGRKFQCLSFKVKGKCSKGEACAFLHVQREKKADEPATGKRARTSTDSAGEEGGGVGEAGEGEKVADKDSGKVGKNGACHAFQKKGSCKKGDRCIFAHVEKAAAGGAGGDDGSRSGSGGRGDKDKETKRRKIDGKVLVERRRENKVTTFPDE